MIQKCQDDSDNVTKVLKAPLYKKLKVEGKFLFILNI